MRCFVVGLLASTVATWGCAERDRPVPDRERHVPESADPKYQEISVLPVGLKVTHSPNPVKARLSGRSGQRYSWIFATSVEALGEAVTITEFGAFGWSEGRWAFANFTGEPFSPDDFADWYSCPGAKINAGTTYTDPNNWRGADVLSPGKSLWYFVGVTADGKKVKGEAVVEELGEVER
jgi:hypothetical protein